MPRAAASRPEGLDIASLPLLADAGYTGGRDSFHRFCRSIFASPEPRFLRNDAGHLVVFRHADLRALSIRPEIGCPPPAHLLARRRVTPEEFEPRLEDPTPWVFANQFFFSNEPIHAPLRKMMLDNFGPRPTATFEAMARATASDLAAALKDGAEVDLAAAFTLPLMVRFWGGLIGLRPGAIARLTQVLHAMAPLNFVSRTPEQLKDLDAAFTVYREVIQQGVQETLARGDNPIVCGLAAALAEVRLQDDPALAGIVPANVGAFLAGNLFDGLHTASVGATNTLFALSRRPEALAAVRAAPDKLAAAVAEALRVEPAILSLNRFALDDTDYDGFVIRKGVTLQMMWAAGGLDPTAFHDPAAFDLDRPHQGVTSFGSGARICPGRFSAAMLIRTMLQALDADGVTLEPLGGEGDWYEGTIVGQLRTFPVRVRRSRN